MRPYFPKAGPPCPCGWRTGKGSPDSGKVKPPNKRGGLVAFDQGAANKCANILCDGPEPTRPPNSAKLEWKDDSSVIPPPSPAVRGVFAKFPKCKNDAYRFESEKVMQSMMKDTRKCTVGKVTTGSVRVKNTQKKVDTGKYFYPNSCVAKSWVGWKPNQLTKDMCIKGCLAAKGIAIQVYYKTTAFNDKNVHSCMCFFTGPSHREWDNLRGPACPCGWFSSNGYPEKGGWKSEYASPVKRGDVEIRKDSGVPMATRSQSALIACDGADPQTGPQFKYEVDWYHPAPRGPLV